MEWKQFGSLRPKKVRVQKSAGNVFALISRSCEAVVKNIYQAKVELDNWKTLLDVTGHCF